MNKTESISQIGPKINHVLFLDGLRAVAALFVVLHHIRLQVPLPSNDIGVRSTQFLDYGRNAVDMFIVLSGFCLMMPVVRSSMALQEGALKFYKRRAKRILPPFYLALGVSLILEWLLIGHKTGTHWDTSLPISAGSVISAVLMLQDVWYPAKINHVFWSVAVEWQIYFWFPVFIALWRRIGPLASLTAIFLLSYVASLILQHIGPSIHDKNVELGGFVPMFYGLFALGMFAAGIVYGNLKIFTELRSRVNWFALAVMLIALLLMLNHLGRKTDLVMGITAACIILDCSVNTSGVFRRIFSWKPLVSLGTFAYSLYLIHAPLIQLMWQYGFRVLNLPVTTTYWLMIVVGTPLIVGLAYLFFLACERPFLNTRKYAKPIEQQTAVSPAP